MEQQLFEGASFGSYIGLNDALYRLIKYPGLLPRVFK